MQKTLRYTAKHAFTAPTLYTNNMQLFYIYITHFTLNKHTPRFILVCTITTRVASPAGLSTECLHPVTVSITLPLRCPFCTVCVVTMLIATFYNK